MRKDIEEHLRYLYMVALRTVDTPSIHRNKIKKMVAMSNKHQIRLARGIKRTLCMECFGVMIPGISCTSRIVRRGHGLCVVAVCRCSNEKTVVMKNR